MLRKLFLLVFAFAINSLFSQNITSTIRGVVLDKTLQQPLPGATVILLNSNPLVGVTTDFYGAFIINNVPVGRQALSIRFIGYEEITLNQLQVYTGKELVLKISLEENVAQLNEVVISAKQSKAEVRNDMATVSARTFSVEESQRFAGARNDVSRMAMNFAGVRGANDAVNDIIIRGNSSSGLLWRYNGVDIPNPNHFGQFGGTGGPVSMLNNNVLSNSDFFTGAFPAEYGNANAGVFDLKLRDGNNLKHEFLGQVGFNGFEFGAEGPLSGNKKGSYLINYRYSTLGVFKAMGIDFGTGAAVPDYQDVSFKVNLPTQNSGNFEIFGLGGISKIGLIGSEIDTNDAESLYGDDNLDIYNQNKMGVLGAAYKKLITPKTLMHLTVAGTYFENASIVDTVQPKTRIPSEFAEQEFKDFKLFSSLFFKTKINAKNNVKVGVIANQIGYNINDKFLDSNSTWIYRAEEDGNATMLQPYVQWQFRPTANLTINTGVHSQYLSLNNNISIEPRVGVKYVVNDNNSLSFGYGLHSQRADLYTYFSKKENELGVLEQPNLNLDFTKSHHFVLAHDLTINKNMRLKTEAYYQYIFDAIVSKTPSSVSLINQGMPPFTFPDSLSYFINGGTGKNYGLEFTLERFMSDGLYYLATVSLFDSKYIGSDGVERNTVFNSRYVVNGLIGKEFELNKNKPNRKAVSIIFADAKATVAGGQRYTPINLTASLLEGDLVPDYSKANQLQFKDYLRIDLNLGVKKIGKKLTQEWSINTQNITNHQNPLFQRYNPVTAEVRIVNQLGLFIIPQWRITF